MSGKAYFRSEEMAVLFGTVNPKTEFSTIPNLDHLLVAIDQVEIEASFLYPGSKPRPGRGPTTRLGPGGVLWVPADRFETIRNLRAQPSRYMFISFKDSAATTKH